MFDAQSTELEAVVGKVQAEDELLIKAVELIKALELQYLLSLDQRKDGTS